MDELLTPSDIERIAAEAGITVPELCKRAGIAHTTFYRWKKKRTSPSIAVYERLRNALRAGAA
jgi:transcriptional regulator with XRE-family HTH domain